MLVDPQGQGRLWLMKLEEANQLKVTQLNDKMFRNHLEDCLTFGKVGMQTHRFRQQPWQGWDNPASDTLDLSE